MPAAAAPAAAGLPAGSDFQEAPDFQEVTDCGGYCIQQSNLAPLLHQFRRRKLCIARILLLSVAFWVSIGCGASPSSLCTICTTGIP